MLLAGGVVVTEEYSLLQGAQVESVGAQVKRGVILGYRKCLVSLTAA